MNVLMNYKDIKGKEVIDKSGNVIGKVSDIGWDKSTRELNSFEVSSGGFLSRGEKKILPFDMIESIGEKILINIKDNETMNVEYEN
jgi:sporulation protein YlmC with PRC-barrel domain